MAAQASPHDANVDEHYIESATSLEEILDSLSRRGCSNLTPSIDLTACSDFPCAGGGFCDVYQGMLDDGTKIAVKALRIRDDTRVKILKRAAKELYHWSRLQHCNVLPLMGLAVFRGHISMVFKRMDNGNLTAYLKRRPDANRIKLCMDICAGLDYIHMNDMVHGDLKAANVMVSYDGTALIADFGNAELKDLMVRFTSTLKVDLSVRWAAPELLATDGNPQPSKEADVYAFGMTVLEALTGRAPFHETSDAQVIFSVLRQKKVPPRPDIGIHDDLWAILNCCWTREPTERPGIASIKDILQVLFQPPFDPWPAEDTSTWSQKMRAGEGNEENKEEFLQHAQDLYEEEEESSGTHARASEGTRRLTVDDHDEGDESQRPSLSGQVPQQSPPSGLNPSLAGAQNPSTIIGASAQTTQNTPQNLGTPTNPPSGTPSGSSNVWRGQIAYLIQQRVDQEPAPLHFSVIAAGVPNQNIETHRWPTRLTVTTGFKPLPLEMATQLHNSPIPFGQITIDQSHSSRGIQKWKVFQKVITAGWCIFYEFPHDSGSLPHNPMQGSHGVLFFSTAEASGRVLFKAFVNQLCPPALTGGGQPAGPGLSKNPDPALMPGLNLATVPGPNLGTAPNINPAGIPGLDQATIDRVMNQMALARLGITPARLATAPLAQKRAILQQVQQMILGIRQNMAAGGAGAGFGIQRPPGMSNLEHLQAVIRLQLDWQQQQQQQQEQQG